VTTLKEKVDEFTAIAKELPENLQVVCFELLLKHHLDSVAPAARRTPPAKPGPEAEKPDKPKNEDETTSTRTVEDTTKKQEDLSQTDLHVKARRFLEKYTLSIDHLNNIFYKEGDRILPLYDDLMTTRMAEGQIRIALLQALHAALTTGDFDAQVEQIRQECTARKCYDGSNFSQNFRNNISLFDFDTYTKETKSVRLSEDGRKELADVIKELQ
jgi:hypothetical protein